MRVITLLLFYITVQDVFTQQSNQCRKILMLLTDDFLAALRKVESEGDICKMSADKLGPYQISEGYYNDAVEANQALRTGGVSLISNSDQLYIPQLLCYCRFVL